MNYESTKYVNPVLCSLFVVLTGKDKSVVLWSIHDHISTLATKTGGTNDKPSESPVIQARGVFQGHEDTVEDVQFCPSRYMKQHSFYSIAMIDLIS